MRNDKLTPTLAPALFAITDSMASPGATAAGAGDILAQAAPQAGTGGQARSDVAAAVRRSRCQP